MSSWFYVVLAVTATFVAVLAGGLTWMVTTNGRRASAVLEAHLESAGWERSGDQVVGTFVDRVVVPFVRSISDTIARVTPIGLRNAVARQLTLAGDPRGWTAELFLIVQVAIVALGVGGGYVVGVRGPGYMLGVLWMPMLGFVGYMVPQAWLGRRAQARQAQIQRHLADTIDLLTISVEAGLAFDAALLHTRRSMRGPLAEELGRMLHEMHLGISRPDAMRHLAERNDVEELRSFVLAMVQADVFGVSIANVLRAQSDELRVKRRQRAEERAMKTPVKLLFPMIACILPALLVLVVGPGVIRIAHELMSGGALGP
jgi:tight adherence protein C